MPIVEHLSRLGPEQLRLLKVIAALPIETRTATSGALNFSAPGIWIDKIVAALQSQPKFWEGNLNLDLEMNLLESLNVVQKVQTMGFQQVAYLLTPLGRHACGFINSAGIQ